MGRLELLAPVGNNDSLKAAIINGANAVYLGLNDFNARSKASNFSLEELSDAIKYAHLFDARVYLAMNILLKDSEINEAIISAKQAADLGVDAFIVQDLSLANLLKMQIPNVELHASTQMGIHNYMGAKVIEELGFKRVILSRESTIEDIKEIKRKTSLEIEFFVQGALCVAFSGNCYFSSLVSTYSGNRGKCLQLCRKKYELSNDELTKSGYYLSAKDLCNLDNLDELVSIGVTSFKIEGRMRRCEYVAEAVRIYRKALDEIVLNATENYKDNSKNRDIFTLKHSEDYDKLKLVFNRGNYCEGYLHNPTTNNIYSLVQGHMGLDIGFVSNLQNNKAVLNLSHDLKKGDGIKFIRNDIEVGTSLIAESNNITTFVGDVKKNDRVFLTNDSTLNNLIASRKRQLLLLAKITLKIGHKAKLCLSYNNINVDIESESNVESSINAPLEKQRIEEVLCSLGDENFKIIHIEFDIENNVYLSIKELKTIRRNALSNIIALILNEYDNKKVENSSTNSSMRDIVLKNVDFLPILNNKSLVFVQIETLNQLSLAIENESDYIVLNPNKYNLKEIQQFSKKYREKAILNLPNIARFNDLKVLSEIVNDSGIDNFIVNNIYGIELCKGKKVIFGYMMNFLNNNIESCKINSIESASLSKNSINYVFGKLPLMTLAHCPKVVLEGSCANCSGYNNIMLKDELGNNFEIRHYRISNCYAQVLNCKPIYNADKAKNAGIGKIFIDLCGYDKIHAENIFISAVNGEAPNAIDYTRGNLGKVLR